MASAPGRFLVVTELFLPTKGGTAVWFDEVYRRIGGKDTHIITADVPGAAEHDAAHPNSIHRVALRRHWWLRPESLGMYLKLLSLSVATALRHRFDAVHAGRVLPEGLVALIVARLIGRRLVIYCHGEELTTWRQPGKKRAMIFTYRHADLLIANSEFTRGELLKLGVESAKVALLSPGVDIHRFRPGLPYNDLRGRIGVGPQQKLLVSVGRLSRRKGFDQVIRSLPELVKRGNRDYLGALAREFGVTDRVSLVGHVDPEELPRWYNAADVVTMPNREINGDTDGFGMVFIEAAACGKPAVAGKAGGTAAAVVDGVTGLRIDGASLEAVTEGLARLLRDEMLAQTLGANGHSRAVANFSWQKVAEATCALHARLGA